MAESALSRKWSIAVRLLHKFHAGVIYSDNAAVGPDLLEATMGHLIDAAWAMQMKAVSLEDPSRLVRSLSGAILGCGGWVLSRGASDSGTVNMLFEFERRACVDIYSILVGAGVELSYNGHRRITELCQCTQCRPGECGSEIASIDLEIETFFQDVKEPVRSMRTG
jgi:hypothetical protein